MGRPATRMRNSTRLRSTAVKKESSPQFDRSSLTPIENKVKLETPTSRKSKRHIEDAEIGVNGIEEDEKPTPSKKRATTASPRTLKDRKAELHAKYTNDSPFPTFLKPTPEDCQIANDILTKLHGPRVRPKEVKASTTRAGCGDSPSVLDALVRTILSQNTSDTNSTRAKLSMDKEYGGSDEWEAIVAKGQPVLEEAIRCGGLSQVKSKVILQILAQVKEKYGVYSLDHLHKAPTTEAMTELLAFDGVGPKTASCVLLFCLQREDFAVDTHVHRITGLLGWRPKTANRDQTYHHLNKRVPDPLKYALHILLVTHGKRCESCKAGSRKAASLCPLRAAFLNGTPKEKAIHEDDGVKEEMVIKEEVGVKAET